MKAVAAAISAMDTAAINAMEKAGYAEVDVNGTPTRVDLCDVEVYSEDIPGWLVANEGTVTVALDVTLTPELKQEGLARDIVNRIQNIRKSRDYDITDRINLVFKKNPEPDEALKNFGSYIAAQVLAEAVATADTLGDSESVEHLDIDGIMVDVDVTKA